MRLKALLFDVDGTLAETERYGHRRAYNKAFAEKKLDWHWDEELYGHLLRVTGGKERIRYFLKRYYPDQAFSNSDIAALHQIKTNHFVEIVNVFFRGWFTDNAH